MKKIENAPTSLADGIIRALAALPEDSMRQGSLGRRLLPLSPEDTAYFLDALYKNEHPHARKARRMLIDPDGLKKALGPQRCREVYLASLRLGMLKVSRLFTDLRPLRTGLAGYDKEEEARMEMITLGQRRALSKSAVKDTLDRLLSDPDPIVIGNILENPRITEQEVLKIASKRPNSPRILKLLACHRRWSKRYNVLKAIALNPYTQPRISIALLEELLTQDLRLVSTDNTVHPQVRHVAKEIISHR
ncbi:MAG: hypothetical protein HY887_05300 [Deltaproteobacteria bacterium]|nr:hypothetical protein [Deltaproteobacteria bacterium]